MIQCIRRALPRRTGILQKFEDLVKRDGPIMPPPLHLNHSDLTQMADVLTPLQIEIQYLKDALVASQRKSDQYAQLGPF